MSEQNTTQRSEADEDSRTTASQDEETDRTEVAELRGRIEVLREENDRLRQEYVRARQSEHHRAALALALLGLVALGGAAVLTNYRELLIALGGTGLFGAVLAYYLSPSKFVPASVNERIHAAQATNQASLIDELGLQPTRVYVPTPDAVDPVRLFIPQQAEYTLPDSIDQLFITSEDAASRGVAFTPVGSRLYEEFESTVTGDPAESPAMLAAQLSDAAVEVFELATAVQTSPDLEADRIVVTLSEPVYGDVDAPDHPVVSLIGTGLAIGLNTPVTAHVETADARGDAHLIFEW